MPKLELILVLLVSFQISALAHFLINRLSENSIIKATISLLAGTSSILILKPILGNHLVPGGYRTWFGFVVMGTLVGSVFVYCLSWVRGELEGEGAAYKTSLFARATLFFLTFSLFISYLIVLGRASWFSMLIVLGLTLTFGHLITKRKRRRPWKGRVAWEVDYYLTVALSAPLLLIFLAPSFLRGRTNLIFGLSAFLLVWVIGVLRRGFFRHRKHSDPFDAISYREAHDFDRLESNVDRSHVRTLWRVALIRVVVLWLIAMPVVFVSGTPGRVGVSVALFVYVALEGLVIHSHIRLVARTVNLLHRIGP